MKRLFIPLVLAACFSSCSQKDTQFCECMNAGKELNDFSEKLWNKEVTASDAKKQEELNNAKKEACKDYQTMGGAEMLKRKAACEES